MFEPFTAVVSPNPATNELALDIFLPEKSRIDVKIFDKNGKKSHICINKELEKGKHSLIFDISSLTSGVYMLSINAKYSQNNLMFIISK